MRIRRTAVAAFGSITIVLTAISKPQIVITNSAVKDFVGPNLIGIQASMFSISLAVICLIITEINQIEATANKRVFDGARRELKQDVIVSFLALLFTVSSFLISGALTASDSDRALLSGISLAAFFVSIIAQYDIIKSAFAVKRPLKKSSPP
jgi:hypothetical protein